MAKCIQLRRLKYHNVIIFIKLRALLFVWLRIAESRSQGHNTNTQMIQHIEIVTILNYMFVYYQCHEIFIRKFFVLPFVTEKTTDMESSLHGWYAS